MKIVIIDKIDFSSSQIEKLQTVCSELNIYDDTLTDDDKIIERCKDCEIIVLGWTKLSSKILKNLIKLKYISIWATGFDYVDIDYANKNNIVVSNIPSYAKQAVAEYTIGAMLSLSRNFIMANQHVLDGFYSWKEFGGIELFRKTLGIIGYGNIGKRIATIGKAFDMKIISYTRNPPKLKKGEDEIKFVNIQEVFRESDFISINIPLNENSFNLIDLKILELMKKNAFLINTSRHEIINQQDLFFILENKKIRGAALDDINTNLEIKKLPNLLLTPHIAFFTEESIEGKSEICIENILSFINNNPQNLITKINQL